MKLSEVVYKYRKQNGLSMDEMAVRCNLSKGYISLIEKGINAQTNAPIQPKGITLAKLAKGMNLKLDDFIKLLGQDESFDFLLTAQEDNMMAYFRQLNSLGKEIALNQVRLLANTKELTK